MRFGCCLNMVAESADGTGIEKIERLAGFGYDYVEMPLAEMMALPEKNFINLANRIEQAGIRCEVCNNFFPKGMRLTGPSVKEEEILAYVEKAMIRAHRLGVQNVVFGSGGAKNVPEGFSLEEGYIQVVSLLRKVSPIARKNDVAIAIEPLRKAECNLINTFAEGCRLAKDVDMDNVKALVDFYHFSEEHEPVQDILDSGKDYLLHVHFACDKGRVFPKTIDEDNYQPFIDALKAVGYHDRVSVEAYTTDFDKQAPIALEFLRKNFN